MLKRILLFSFISLGVSHSLIANSSLREFRNVLNPYTSDGCSQFPDSIAGMNYEACCRAHDHAYWKGGTYEQKIAADLDLEACVGEKSFEFLGASMKVGVGIGGSAALPTTWRWGFGWKISRGYRPLSQEQEDLAEDLYVESLEDLELNSPGVIPYRDQVSGDYCIDLALNEILKEIGVEAVDYAITVDRKQSGFVGYKRVVNIKIKGCHQPFTAKFLLLKSSACTERVGELLARSRVRLESFKSRCSKYEKSRF